MMLTSGRIRIYAVIRMFCIFRLEKARELMLAIVNSKFSGYLGLSLKLLLMRGSQLLTFLEEHIRPCQQES